MFSYFAETADFNGVFLQTLYGAATAPLDAKILEGSRIEIDYTPVPEPRAIGLLGISAMIGFGRRRS